MHMGEACYVAGFSCVYVYNLTLIPLFLGLLHNVSKFSL
jgi:hypothetical protein